MSTDQKQGIPEGLNDYAKKRSAEFVGKIRKAMQVIESEIEQNDGLYPYNAGRPTKSELCRRAGVDHKTLQNKTHKDTTNKMVDKWLDLIKGGLALGKKVVRKTVTNRADAWKAAHDMIGNQYHLAKLENIDAKAKLREAQKQIASLKKEVADLREQLMRTSGKNVHSFKPKEK